MSYDTSADQLYNFRMLSFLFIFIFQVSELRAKLTASREQNAGQRKQGDDLQNEYRRLEQQLGAIREDRDTA